MKASYPFKGCFSLGAIFRAQRNFSLFVSSNPKKDKEKQPLLSGKQPYLHPVYI